jgi:uncharacterized protein (TIGR00251 family)
VDVSDLYSTEGEENVVLAVHLQPGAGRSAVVGRHGAALKMRVAAAPEGGRANQAAAALLAETFGASPSAVELVGGATSRAKRVRLSGLDLDEFRRRLERLVAEGSTSQGPSGTTRGGTKHHSA